MAHPAPHQGSSLQLPTGSAAPNVGSSGPLPASSSSPRRAVSPHPESRGGIVVFSGGSAANSLVDVFERIREANRATLSYVIPISDNGGSTSEIIRVFGGPGASPFPSLLVSV